MFIQTFAPCGCSGGPRWHSSASAGAAMTDAAAPSAARRDMRPSNLIGSSLTKLPVGQSIAWRAAAPRGSLVRRGTAPAGQVIGIRAFGQLHGLFHGVSEIVV